MDKLDSQAVIQIGMIVRDARKVAGHFAEAFGIPKPEIVTIAADAIADTRYRGRPSNATGKAAFFKLGPVEMEVIEPVGGPSTWEEFLRTRGEGIHHIAIRTDDMAQAVSFLASKGMETIQTGAWEGGQYAYIDGAQHLGTILELLHFDQV